MTHPALPTRSPPRSETAALSKASLTCWLLLGTLALSAIALRSAAPLNHDVAWVLQGANRILDGAVFGRDVVDVNPPLAWWIALVPAALARVLGTDLVSVWLWFVATLCLASVGLTHWIVTAQGSPVRQSAPIFTLAVGAALLLIPGYDFGQREHLMIIAAVPYIAAAARRADGGRIRPVIAVGIGLFAAAGLCLKPHFILLPVVLEVWLAASRRSWRAALRPETVGMAGFGAVYALSVVAFAPEYLSTILPDAASNYWAYNNSARDVANAVAWTLAPVVVVAVFAITKYGSAGLPPLPKAFLLTAAATSLSALLQLKGWSYHLLPVAVAGATCCGAVLAAGGSWERSHRIVPLSAVFLTILLPLQRDIVQVRGGQTSSRVQRLAAAFEDYAAPAGSVYAFITSPRDIHPAVLKADVRWASASCCLSFLPALVRLQPGDQSAAAIREAAGRQLTGIAAELRADMPSIIAIDDSRRKLGFGDRDFSYLPWLAQDRRFRDLLQDYSERERIENFRIFVRKGARRG